VPHPTLRSPLHEPYLRHQLLPHPLHLRHLVGHHAAAPAGRLRVRQIDEGTFIDMVRLQRLEDLATQMRNDAGRRLVVGTAVGDLNILDSGIDVFVFDRRGTRFEFSARLKTSTAPSEERLFGQSVTIIGKRIAVGEMRGFRDTDGGGRLLFYELPPHGEDEEGD
jgi:hypothetical protein